MNMRGGVHVEVLSQVYPKNETEPVAKTQFSYKETSMMNKFQKDRLKFYHTIMRKLQTKSIPFIPVKM
jgi:hypothetical protein